MPTKTQNSPTLPPVEKTNSSDLETIQAVLGPRPGTPDLKESRKVRSVIRLLDAATGKITVFGDAQSVVLELGAKLFPLSRVPAGRRSLKVKRTLNHLPDYGGAALEALNQLHSIYYHASYLKGDAKLADFVDRPLRRIHKISEYFPHDGRDVRTTLIERVRILILVIARDVKAKTQDAAGFDHCASSDNGVAPPDSPDHELADNAEGGQKDRASSCSPPEGSKELVASDVSKGEDAK